MDDQQNHGGAPPAKSPGPDAQTRNGRIAFAKRRPVIIAGTTGLAVLLFLALHYFVRGLTHESTDNAFLDGDIVAIAPKISGHVTKVYVVNNQAVKAGDPILEIDR